MTHSEPHPDERDGALLSGYLDGELTQQERQRVERRLENDGDFRRLFEALKDLRLRTGRALNAEFGNDRFREAFATPSQRALHTVGWWMLIAGLIVLGAGLVVVVWQDNSTPLAIRAALTITWLGLGTLFVAVLRRRRRESRTDKYNDVEI